MAKSDFRKFVPEMSKAFHFGKTQKQFYDAVIAVRGPRMKAGIEKYLATPFKGITTDGNIIPDLFKLRPESRADARNPGSCVCALIAAQPGAKKQGLPADRLAGA